MPVKTHTCISVECDTCHETYGNDDGFENHFTSEDEARSFVADSKWLITPEGRVVCEGCGADDAEHREHFAEAAR